jgi:hypothetical protein
VNADPLPGELWGTPKGRTVEILAADTVYNRYTEETGVIAYRFLGGSMIHLRSVDSLVDWHKINGE